jgi:hypothetical protein
MADTICLNLGVGDGADGLYHRFHDTVFKRWDISEKEFINIMIDYQENIDHIQGLLALV